MESIFVDASTTRESKNIIERILPVEVRVTEIETETSVKRPPPKLKLTAIEDHQSESSSIGTRGDKDLETCDPQIISEWDRDQIKSTPSRVGLKNISSYFMQKVEDDLLQSDSYSFTRLMHYIWSSRLDLQTAFDIQVSQGRIEYAKWFLYTGSKEYGLPPEVYPSDLLDRG